jgi:hypothetical protein
MKLTAAELAGICLKKFAAQYRLKLRQPTNHLSPGPHPDLPHIPGKHGWLRALDSGDLKLVFTGSIHNRFRFHRLLREVRATEMVVQSRGDYELAATFDPENDAQVKFALGAIQARRRRSVKVTEEMRESLRAGRERLRGMRSARRRPFLEVKASVEGPTGEVQA